MMLHFSNSLPKFTENDMKCVAKPYFMATDRHECCFYLSQCGSEGITGTLFERMAVNERDSLNW